nr:hypothetical protein [Tanacetum cinerariifolium]
MKSMNNEALLINAEPISVMHPSNIVENIVDSRNTSSKEGGLSSISPDAPSYLEAQKVPAQASKVAGDASTPLDVDSDPDMYEFPSTKELKYVTDGHWVAAHVTPPSWKQYLMEISIEQLCDIRDRAYMRQADNVLNELEKKCNQALKDLDKNPLVSDMRAEIETLQSRVNGLYSEYSRLILKENKWINYEQTLSTLRAKFEGLESKGKRLRAFEIQHLQEVDSLRQDRAVVVARVILDVAMKLIHRRDGFPYR